MACPIADKEDFKRVNDPETLSFIIADIFAVFPALF